MRMAIIALQLGALKIPDVVESQPPVRTVKVKKRCPNPKCVTNREAYLDPEFEVVSELMLSCVYCEHEPLEDETPTAQVV